MSEDEAITLDIAAVVVCDDIRREDNGKQILIGVYNESINVPQFPAPLGLWFWIQATPSRPGMMQLSLRLTAGEAIFLDSTAAVKLDRKELSSISAGPIPCFFQQASELKLDARSQASDPWKTIKTIKVVKVVPQNAP